MSPGRPLNSGGPRLAWFGSLARSTGHVFAWHAVRLGLQLFWAVLLARVLGAQGYGLFSGLAGLAIGLSGLAGVGLGLRMYQEAVTEPDVFARRWAQARRALVWSCSLLGLVFVAVSLAFDLFPGASAPLLVAVAVSELVLAPALTLVAFGYAAHGRMAESATVPAILSLARVLAALVFLASPGDAGLATYAWLHAAGTAAAVAFAAWLFLRSVDVGPASPSVTGKDLAVGLGFTSVWVSGTALASFDKTAALHLGGAAAAGTYTASYRFASLLALPVDALVMSALPRLFHAGLAPGKGRVIVARLLLATAGYGVIAGLLLGSMSGALPWILGEQFTDSVAATQVLAWYLPFFCIRSLGANILLAFSRKLWRFSSELAGLLLLMALMAAWVPAGGAVAAAKALLFTEIALMSLVWVRILPLLRDEPGDRP